jgi:hypothetical protein
MRLIDADALRKVLSDPLYRSTIKDYGEILKYTFVMDIIDNAPTIKPPEVIYLCDGHGCSAMCGGKSEYCKHTSNIESAKNFESITGGDRCIYVEKDEKTTNGGDDTKGGKE